MSVPPKTDQDVPPPHRRTLPHFPVNEQGMRELEIWLKDLIGQGGKGFIRYVFKNVGKWLYVRTTGFVNPPLNRSTIGNPSVLFDDRGGYGFGIIIGTSTSAHMPEWNIDTAQMQYVLDGAQDIGYSQGGDILRYSGGGNITFYTTDGSYPNSGDFQVSTQGSSGAADDAGDVTFSIEPNGGGGVAGTFFIESDSTAPLLTPTDGSLVFQMAEDAMFLCSDSAGATVFVQNEDGGGTLNINQAANTFTIKDSGGNPLVTYTG